MVTAHCEGRSSQIKPEELQGLQWSFHLRCVMHKNWSWRLIACCRFHSLGFSGCHGDLHSLTMLQQFIQRYSKTFFIQQVNGDGDGKLCCAALGTNASLNGAVMLRMVDLGLTVASSRRKSCCSCSVSAGAQRRAIGGMCCSGVDDIRGEVFSKLLIALSSLWRFLFAELKLISAASVEHYVLLMAEASTQALGWQFWLHGSWWQYSYNGEWLPYMYRWIQVRLCSRSWLSWQCHPACK